ncbi:hypothetical protein H9Q69_002991 [Fusarium xylarioides]|nr:hypothetical protein H9Q69_002991 [Fusarium xylarioides]
MAAEAVKWAISEGVDVISMSWTIKPENQNQDDITALRTQIHRAGTAGISLFCSSDDIGSHATVSTLLPAPNEFLRRVGSCDGNGLISDFVTASHDVHYLFPGEKLPIMHHYLKGKSSREAGDQGSSASTALASGLAALILWCAVRSGCDKKEFANERMYGIFDKLKVEQGSNKGPSLVDVSGIMNRIREDSDTPIKAVEAFIDRLKKECIPQQLREYHDREKAALKSQVVVDCLR